MASKLDQTQKADLQAQLYNNRQQVPIPQLKQLLENELELVNTQILEAESTDNLRILQGEGRRIKKILAMFDKRPLTDIS